MVSSLLSLNLHRLERQVSRISRTLTPSLPPSFFLHYFLWMFQVDYIMGRNPTGYSYLVGFGRNPTHIHHRASSLPSMRANPWNIGCSQGFSYYWSGNPNPNQATGAVLGGPDQSDHITDSRSNYAQTEPTTYITAPMVGVLAALATGRVYY